jgi:hypothetical protein
MQLRGTDLVVDKIRAKKNVISGQGATRSLNENESGSTVLFDRAAGIVYTLPTAKPGTHFDFAVTTTVTSNAHKVITGAGEFLIGGYTNVDTDTANAVASFLGNGTTHRAINMAAASSNATGGLQGSKLRFTCLTSTLWAVEGLVEGAGTVATAFATS